MNEVGEKLKEARKEKGYTLDDLQQITKIQKRYLVAIEEGNLDSLPGNFYARAFIKQYADTVGLDGDKLLEEYTDYIPSPNDRNYTKKIATTQTRSRSKQNDWLTNAQENLPVILIIVLVLAIIIAIYAAIVQNDSGSNEARIVENGTNSVQIATNADIQNQQEETDTAAEEDTSEETKDTSKEADEEETAAEQTVEVEEASQNTATFAVSGSMEEEHTLTLRAENDASWVSVEADGTVLDQGTIESGGSMEVTLPAGTESAFVVVGNAPETTLELNGEEFSTPSETDAISQRLTIQFSE
ncbi:helix-turn-helix domain-containing protein [Atopococcus tabaci]|uniref:helix-turn-helix domain-containing protein n=1 Tax=Atopococcus tabaci TaxID=269774 RepID=UPI0004237CE5|nr:helix-turn-helix domain-containing protein [Atopococcus tabaci]